MLGLATRFVILGLLFLSSPGRSLAAPAIGNVNVTPRTAVVGTPTQVTVTASISDSTLIAGGVNLLQISSTGQATVLGIMHDDGLDGDVRAGDGVYTVHLMLNATVPSQIGLQVSAAFRGVPQRMRWPVTHVWFQSPTAPNQAVSALATALTAGDITAAMVYVVPSPNALRALSTFNPAQRDRLAGILNRATLLSTGPDLRTFASTVPTANGSVTTTFTMVPGENGQWMISTW